VDKDNQEHQSEPQTGKRGVLRAYALIISAEAALIALLWAVHVPWGVVNILAVLALIAVLIGKQLTGPAEHVNISSPTFEHRIQNRYYAESNQLSNLGFTPLFFYGEAFPLFRLLLIYPAFLFLIMWLNREVMSIQDGSRSDLVDPEKAAFRHLQVEFEGGFALVGPESNSRCTAGCAANCAKKLPGAFGSSSPRRSGWH
jgi:hypothetical protein